MLHFFLVCCLTVLAFSAPVAGRQNDPNQKEWLQLFNGRDLRDWVVKFTHHDLGANFNDTFRVEDGLLKVRYDKWTGFNREFGHIFYKQPFSYYLLAAEYRFVGEQLPAAGPALAWARRNNGLMLHAPDPKTMLKDQDFPISIEVQLLGGLADGKPRTTANLCTPGTHVVINGKLHTPHCTNSTSKTYDGDQWVRVEVLVHGDELIRHMIDGQTVLEYTKPQIGGGSASPTDPAVKVDGTPLTGGFISLQAETAPADFRKVELLNLEGCTDPKARNYKTYFVKSNASMCRYAPIGAEVKVEKVTCLKQPNCYRLSNGVVEVIVTTDVGPRVVRYGFIGEDNLLGETGDDMVKTELGTWKPLGGHRLWTAPEAMPRSYAPDNDPVAFTIDGGTIKLVQPVEAKTGIQKELSVTLEDTGTGVTVQHRLTNRNVWDIEVAPWALTIMNGGGEVIVPHEPYRSHDDYLLPARPLALWHYTDLSDPRWTIGKKYIRLKTNAQLKEPQKIGIGNAQQWAAYLRNRTLFVKRYPWVAGATYPDFGSNTETYTAGTFIELETLAPLAQLGPGGSAEHVERWFLFRNVDAGTSEQSLDAALGPLVAQTSLR